MEDQREIVVLSAVRTPIGKFGGGLAAVPPCDLAAAVVWEAVGRAGVEPAEVGHAVFGNVIHTEVRDMYLSRVAAVNGGLPVETPAFTLNRLCGSGLQAIVSAAQAVRVGIFRRRPGPAPARAAGRLQPRRDRAEDHVHRRRPGHRRHLRTEIAPGMRPDEPDRSGRGVPSYTAVCLSPRMVCAPMPSPAVRRALLSQHVHGVACISPFAAMGCARRRRPWPEGRLRS